MLISMLPPLFTHATRPTNARGCSTCRSERYIPCLLNAAQSRRLPRAALSSSLTLCECYAHVCDAVRRAAPPASFPIAFANPFPRLCPYFAGFDDAKEGLADGVCLLGEEEVIEELQ